MNKAVGVVSVVALLGTVFACSSSTTTNSPAATPTDDAGNKADATPTPKPDASKPDTGIVEDPDASLANDNTVGELCSTLADCEKAGEDDKFCSNDYFAVGTLNPSPVCIGTCVVAGGTNIQTCDGDRGICLDAGSTGLCLPLCTFDDTATAPDGCKGKNLCTVGGYGKDTTTNKAIGVGYCFGGCAADADCTTGEKCQVETGVCAKPAQYKTYNKAVGAVCTGRTDTGCACQAPASGPGLCTTACKTAATPQSTCPATFLCTADLPKTNAGGALFTTQPVGLAGTCRKSCTTDADCGGAPNGYCDDNDVLGPVCSPGPRPAGG